jgi:hypothetical protein
MASVAEMEVALRNAHSAGDTYAAKKLANAIHAAKQAPIKQQEEEIDLSRQQKEGIDWARQLALAGRAIGESALNIPAMAKDVFTGNMLGRMIGLPKEYSPLATESVKDFFDKYSYTPGTPEERLISDVIGGAYGATIGGPAKFAASAALGGGVGGAASGIARESGASVPSQIAAGLLGNIGSYGLIEALKSGTRGVGRVLDTAFFPGGDVRGARRIAADAIGEQNRMNVANQVINAKSPIPGMPLNFGQASVGSGSTGAAGLQKIINESKYGSDAAQSLKERQQLARLDELGTFAKDKSALAEAESFRSAQADKQFKAAFDTAIKADPELAIIARNPYYRDAIGDALKEAKARGINPKERLTEYLHMVKKSLDGDLARPAETGLKPMQKASVTNVKKNLLDWMKNKNPQYRLAIDEFDANSRLINQMQVGQYLQERLRHALDTSERPSAYAEALRNSPATIKKSSGIPFQQLDQILTPEQMKSTQRVMDSLWLDAKAKELGLAGQDAARLAARGAFDRVETPNLLNRAAMLGNFALRQFEGKGGDASIKALADMMNNNPKMLAEELAKMTPAQRATIWDVIRRGSISQAGLLGAQQ